MQIIKQINPQDEALPFSQLNVGWKVLERWRAFLLLSITVAENECWLKGLGKWINGRALPVSHPSVTFQSNFNWLNGTALSFVNWIANIQPLALCHKSFTDSDSPIVYSFFEYFNCCNNL